MAPLAASAGTIQVVGGGVLSPATTLDMNGGAVDIGGSSQTVSGLKGATGIIQGGGILTVDQAANTIFGGDIAGVTGGAVNPSGTSVNGS